jgi:predicted kinase
MSIDELIESFIARLTLPAIKADTPFIVGIIGNLGSGKSAVARMLTKEIAGSVVLSADSARYLLKEADMPWGDNVRVIVRGAAERLIADGYAVILDGSNAELKEREQTAEAADRLHVPVRYVRITVSAEVARERLKAKYDDPSWESSFERFRVGTTDKMLINFDDRQIVHDSLDDKQIIGLVGVIDNSGSAADLGQQIKPLAHKILQSLDV